MADEVYTKDQVLDALRNIPCDKCNYTDWVNVGMALKSAGFDCDVWDSWSATDPQRYNQRVNYKKWETFENGGITIGTLIHMAKEYGWSSYKKDEPVRALAWDDILQDDGYIEGPLHNYNGNKDLIEYLETMFDPEEYVSYVTEVYDAPNGRFSPKQGVYTRTAQSLIESLKKSADITDTIGTYNEKAGAWIRFNPVDGQGIKNDNVTRFRYALVESDVIPIAEQDSIYRNLKLPIEFLINSGGKSLHAIVKVDAKDKDEYRKRVDFLYEYLKKKGINIDFQNRNPSRLSRLPGVIRNGKPQYIVDRNIGCSSWVDWLEYIEGEEDELPSVITMADYIGKEPQLPEELIEGILRVGHKMLISGASKAGKSFLLMELCVAIAEGRKWLGFNVKQGKVMYVNLEIDDQSCIKRFKEIYRRMGIPENRQTFKNLYIWNLRGKAESAAKLVKQIVRRFKDEKLLCIVIDPIYKIQTTGDENNASDMAKFCNEFDKLCTQTGASAVYCHHHSKGTQGMKKAQDRASGSGVFARDPDAILDLIELDISESIRNLHAECESSSAWQVETSLREFPNMKPLKIWFDYPLHRVGGEELENCYPEGSKNADAKKEKESEDIFNTFLTVRNNYTFEGKVYSHSGVYVKDMAQYLQKTENAVKRLCRACDKLKVSGDVIYEKPIYVKPQASEADTER